MRLRFALPVFALAGVAVPQLAAAQDEGVELETTAPNYVMIPRHVSGEAMGAHAVLAFKHKMHPTRTCFNTGCLIVVNETTDYDAVGLFFDTGSPDLDDAPVWSPNLFTTSLPPRDVRWTFKTGNKTTCSVATMVVLRHRQTGKEISSLGETSLCKSPRRDSALRIKVLRPQVFIGDEEKPD
jgi:hypothetical protein